MPNSKTIIEIHTDEDPGVTLNSLAKSDLKTIKMDPKLVRSLVEYLYREYLYTQRKQQALVFKPKHSLVLGMLLRYIELNNLDIDNKQYSINKLYEIATQKTHLEKLATIPQYKFYANAFVVMLDNLQYLRAPVNITDKFAILGVMKKSFTEQQIKEFGVILAQSINAGHYYTREILERIYDLRLGLRDLPHLNNQIKTIKGSRYNQYTDSLVAENMSRLWVSPSASLIGENKRFLACNIFSGEHAPTDITRKELARKIKSILDISNSANIHGDRIKRAPVSIGNLKTVLSDIISSGDTNAILQVNDLFHSKDHSVGMSYTDLHLGLQSHGAGNWTFHDPNMPQEYVRFSNDNLSPLHDYLVDICGKATDKHQISTEFHNKGIFITYSLKRTLRFSQPLSLRRSETPSTNWLQDPELQNNNNNIRKSASTPQLRA